MQQVARSKAGKVALVTGAARGLGYAFARRLAAEGASVVAVDLANAPELADDLKKQGAHDASVHRADITDPTQVETVANAVLEAYGHCDILVNNAGISPNVPFAELTYELWRHTMATNVEGAFLFCKALAPSMIEQSYGRIVNIASDTLGLMINGFAHYVASKGAVVGLTRGLSNDLGVHGITVNCIAPGLTRTPDTEAKFEGTTFFEDFAQAQAIKRSGVPEDLVGAMSFLTSDDAAFITGQTIMVNGGLLKTM